MKYAIIADIHANLPALQTVLRDSEQQGCTHTACLGDIVGYGWQPNECADIVRGMNIPCVKGNFDLYSSTEELPDLNTHAAETVLWTREQLTEENRQWLRNLPFVQIVDGFTIVHGHLSEPERWQYVFDKLAAASSFEHQTTVVCFFGHTHVPVAFIRDSVVRGGTFSKFQVDGTKHYFINAGSVGQPRDHNPRAAYLTYDLDTQVVELRRLDYPRPQPPPGGPGIAPVPKSPTGPKGPLTAKRDREAN